MPQTRSPSPFYASPQPVLVAERARGASRPGVCALCTRPYRRGDYVADLAGRQGVAHVSCTGQLAGGVPR